MHSLTRPWLFALALVAVAPALAQTARTAAPVAATDDAGVDANSADAGDTVAETTATTTTTPPSPPPPPAFDDALADSPLVTTSDVIITFLKAMSALAIVLGLAWLTLGKGIPKLVEKAQAGKRVKVIERIALDARRSLFLVEIDGRQMVLGGGDVVKVHDMQDVKDREKAARFAEVLATPSTSTTPPISGPSPFVEQQS